MTTRALLISLVAIGCSEAAVQPSPRAPATRAPDPIVAEKKIPPYQGRHPIDRLVHPLLAREGIKMKLAGKDELCRRLMGDLLGKLPTRAELATECGDRSADEIARDFQSRDRYLLVSERHWRDRFDTDDIVVDWRYLKELFLLVDELHLGQITYATFAEKVLSHPGFVLTQFLPDEMAKHAFRSFLGREATEAEAADLAALYRMWVPGQEMDPDFPYIYTLRAYFVPSYCSPLTRCRSKLFGDTEISFGGVHFGDYLRWENLDEVDKDTLAEVGRLFAKQPVFWEAAADEILDRLLGWSDGGRFPRAVGAVLPEVRQVVADYLQKTGDYPGAERLVLTSWLYLIHGVCSPRSSTCSAWIIGPSGGMSRSRSCSHEHRESLQIDHRGMDPGRAPRAARVR